MSAPALRALKIVAERAKGTGCHVSVCGEMGGRPLEAMALIALGYRSLSMSPASIGPIKAMLLKLDVGRVAAELDTLLNLDGAGESLRPALEAFAARHDIPL
jgi:phosphotransferase system enzyme I (PtsP)